MKNIEEKLIKTKLEIEAKEYEQKQGYKGLLDALYEEGQNKGYECARSYITPYIVRAYLAGAEPREKHIAELEKENAELKDYRLTTLAKQQTENQKYTVNLEHKLSWYDDQLTKAKEIIKEFMKYEINEYDGSLEIHFEELKKQAEQFLSEVEK